MSKNIENVGTGIGWLERVLELISKYKIFDFIKAFILVIMTALIVGFIAKPSWIFEQWEKYDDKRHKEKMEIVEKNNVIIHTELENILYKTGADRVLLLSYHNSKESLTGLPYIYLSAINEAINFNIKPVAEGYESVKCSLYPAVTYLNQQGYFCGNIEELRAIDKALAYRMEGNDVQHLALLNIDGEYPLGVLVCTFTNKIEHNCNDVEVILRRSGVKLGVLLEGNQYKKK